MSTHDKINCNKSVSIIVLCYNDQFSLPKLVDNLYLCLKTSTSLFEIIIVDDGSKDNSFEVAQLIAKKYKNIDIIKHAENAGVGAAFFSGAKKAKYDFVGYIDGDGQYAASDFGIFINQINEVDAISGIRIKRAEGIRRKMISTIYNFFISKIFGLKMADINSGIKLYRRTSLTLTYPIISNGPFFDAEVLIKMKFRNMKIKEIPIYHFERLYGNPEGASKNSIFKTLSEMTKLEFNHFRRNDRLAIFLFNCIKFLNFKKTS